MPVQSVAPRGPIYRYYSAPPEEFSIRLGEFSFAEGQKTPAFDPDLELTLPCSELFSSPRPSMPLQRLAELAPGSLSPEGVDGNVFVNPSALALRYRLRVIQELVEAPPEPVPEPPRVEPPTPVIATGVEEFSATVQAPQDSAIESAPPADEAIPPVLPPAPIPIPRAVLPTETSSPPQASGEPAAKKPFKILPLFRRKTVPIILPPRARETPRTPPVVLPPRRTTAPQPPTEAFPTDSPLMTPPPAEKTSAQPDTPQAAPPSPPPAVESAPPPPAPEESSSMETPLPSDAPPPSETPLPSESVDEPVSELPLSHPPATPVFHLDVPEPRAVIHKPLPLDSGSARLQEIFMTEEVLTAEKVLELCGGLPGIRSCILTRGTSILAVHNAPPGMDLISLTANAVEMLSAIRSSTMRMGLGAIPAVTVHSEKGPVSFFHAEDLALLVLHSDRGFVPGVRERLRDVVHALKSTPLPLPEGDHPLPGA